MILSICDNSSVLRVIYIVNIMITVIKIGVPIALLIAIMIDFMKAIKIGSDDLLAKAKGKVKNRIIAAVLIFLIPTFVNFIINVVAPADAEIRKCIESDKTLEEIDAVEISKAEELIQKAESELTYSSYSSAYSAINRINNPEKKAALLSRLENVQKQIDENNKNKKEEKQNQTGGNNSGNTINDNNNTPTTTTSLTTINTADLGCTLYYSDHVTILNTLKINSAVASDLHSMLTSTCSYVKNNSNIANLETAGAYVDKSGYHGRGLAIDLNNLYSITYNGKTYTPYAAYGGTNSNAFKIYNDFVCEVCNGKEDCDKNVNYQIYYKYFAPKGWCWGGNWSNAYFDPMHFEKTDGPCSTNGKSKISC